MAMQPPPPSAAPTSDTHAATAPRRRRDVCAQCKAYDEGRVDERDRKWYCNTCWSQYNSNSNNNNNNNTHTMRGAHMRQAQQQPSPQPQQPQQQQRHAAPRQRGNTHATATVAAALSGDVVGSACAAAVQRLRGMFASCRHYSPPRTRHGARGGSGSGQDASTAPLYMQLLDTTARRDDTADVDDKDGGCGGGKRTAHGNGSGALSTYGCAFVTDALRPLRPVAAIAHSGEALSPRGEQAGGVGRGAYHDAAPKVALDRLLSSVDDVVSQVYVHLDEDMTMLLLNCLDRVTACATADARERAKVRAFDELREAVGTSHDEVLQCVLYRPREVFLRLLEEFCTLDDDDEADEGGGGGAASRVTGIDGSGAAGGVRLQTISSSSGPRPGALTVQFVRSKQQQQRQQREVAMAFAKNGELTNRRWLAHMNARYRALMQEAELDEIFRRDFSVSGATMPAGVTFTRRPGHVRVHIPPPTPAQVPLEQRVCVATTLPEWAHAAFGTITHLNAVQSALFGTAFHTTQNMLVCAPTGAGKTVCALLVMLRCISDHMHDGVLDRSFKMVFVAPMKALAQEMVANFARRLAPFLIKVRELTGDMQLTKRELAETQVIVTTPEKWDVITRKQSNSELTDHVKLVILDEIHLLNEERGPVLEAVVARTLRQSEADAERRVRLVGLSATLPNYRDVANFLHVDLREGLKVFGAEYRPVPLEQTFLALQDVSRNKDAQLDELAYDEVVANVRAGHQVMVFVHSRKQTIALAKFFVERARQRGQEGYFRWSGGAALPSHIDKKGRSLQGRDLAQLFASGLGAHHAGLVRHDRTATEDLFRDGYLRVLCCTSTLAWGVNLPAHTVILRGTQMYDPRRGGLVSISVLDVMQIFGRAGRPQYDTRGHGVILSDEKEVSRFLRLLAHALPIESQMLSRLHDHLNAEVHAGTVSSVAEGCAWLEYTYLWQRVRVNPLLYGLKVGHVRRDPHLRAVRQEIVHGVFADLAFAGMVRYNADTGVVESTDLGRLASHYYLTHETIRTFNEKLRRADGTWIDALDVGAALNVAACASEFAQLRVRQEELDELRALHLRLPRTVRDYRVSDESTDETSVQWKVTTLLKAYVSRLAVEEHSLSADTYYIVQNMPRIARALFEVELQRGHPLTTHTFLTLCKCVEHRCWDFEHPLLQFSAWGRKVNLTDAVWSQLAQRQPSMSMLRDMTAKELGALVRNARAGRDIAALVRHFPSFALETRVQPITRTILRVAVSITATFEWSRDVSGSGGGGGGGGGGGEQLWLLVEDCDNHFIFHHESVTITRKEVEAGVPHVVHLAVPIVPQYDMYAVRLYSDRWLGCTEDYAFSVGHLHLPDDGAHATTTPLLPLRPLSLRVLPDRYYALYDKGGVAQLNAVQTQVFHTMYHTDENVFLGAPTGSGKTLAAELAVLRVFEQSSLHDKDDGRGGGGGKVVYIAPLKALVKERLRDWRTRMARIGRRVVELSGDATPDMRALATADVLCTTPEKWDGVSRNWQVRRYVTAVRLVIFDEVHVLGTDRGPILEVIVSRMRHIGWHLHAPVRLVGLSTAVANPADLSTWLGVTTPGAAYNFDASVRPVPMTVHIAGYHGKHYCPRMMAMNKPVYNAICEKSAGKPVIVFVSSRRQTRYTALALIGFLMLDGRTGQWVHDVDVDEMAQLTARLQDDTVKHCLQFGVGLHHAGLAEGDRAVVEQAFLAGKVQILVATTTLAWGVNFPAHMVVVKGTEYYDAKTHAYVDYPITDLLQMIGRAGRPQYDTEGVAQVLCQESKKSFYRKFLYDPFPVESALHTQLHVHLNAEVVSGTVKTRQDALHYLTWTFLFRRLVRNPSYYGLDEATPEVVLRYCGHLVDEAVAELRRCGCIAPRDGASSGDGDGDGDDEVLQHTALGKLCSYYYISHRTVDLFRRSLTATLTHAQLLRLLCDAEEFNELPVRHNEDKRNLELAKELPLPIRGDDAESPHVKAFLLFQAQFARTPLPVDYATDQKLTLDNAVRVVQAMVDVAAYHGHLHTTLRCMTLMQCMVQARWWCDATLLQLPHVRADMLPVLRARCGVAHAAELANAPLTVWRELQAVLELADYALTPQQVREAMAGVRGLPLLDVHVTATAAAAAGGDGDDGTRAASAAPAAAGYAVHVHLTRLSSAASSTVVAPHFSKAKDEQYWVVVGHEASGELVALKRLNRLQHRATVTLHVDWDDDWCATTATTRARSEHASSGHDADEAELSVYVVCDAYLGMDQHCTLRLPRPHA